MSRIAEKKNQLKAYQVLQRKILEKAVALLKHDGILVYSTCSLREEENEVQVRWLLDRYGNNIRLVKQEPILSPLDWKSQKSLSLQEAELIQKFDPRLRCPMHSEDRDCLTDEISQVSKLYNWDYHLGSRINCDNDTIGFFLAKFVKF